MAKTPPEQEALQQWFNKGAKLLVARQAVLTQDLAELAKADRDKVRRMEDKKLFGGTGEAKPEEPVGDIIVCDDYNASNNVPPPSRLPVLGLAAVTALAGLGAAGFYFFQPKTPTTPIPVVVPGTEYEAVYEVQQADGTWKEVRREKLK